MVKPVEDTSVWRRAKKRIRKRWRPLLRALHRDAGYLAIGLTVIYAVSGIAINHIGDEGWNPNFSTEESTTDVPAPLPADEAQATARVLAALGIDEKPSDFYLVTDDQLEIYVGESIIHATLSTGHVYTESQHPRWFLRVANWLHKNRAKSAWTYIADSYAVFLLFIAVSGAFMIRGKKGILGRGAVLIVLGAVIPFLYVQLSGGPGG
ncbi:MAG TPA: PepSY-associated TM helix domain-containing protein [Kofleriaceae bacterium]|nr:PepSY-associated TM helix domain-containing protein [Kofleriaceae bacterium]